MFAFSNLHWLRILILLLVAFMSASLMAIEPETSPPRTGSSVVEFEYKGFKYGPACGNKSAKPVKPPPAKEPLAPSLPAYSYEFLAGGSYDYIEVAQAGLGPVLVNTITPGFDGISTTALVPKPSWRSALDIDLGMTLPSGWSVLFNYFLLWNKNNKLMEVADTSFTDFAWQWNNLFNRFTLLLVKDGSRPGRKSLLLEKEAPPPPSCLSATPFVALMYAYETQWFNTIQVEGDSPDPVTTLSKNSTQKWYAFGPYSGIEVVVPIPRASFFAFVFQTGFGILPAKINTNKDVETTTTDLGISTSETFHIENSFKTISTVFDFLLGARLHSARFFLQIAWVGELWPNHLQSFGYSSPDNPQPPTLAGGTYSTNGVRITGGVTF